MKRVDEFFEKMDSQFLESDKDSFQEIKEDLLEHIAIQLEKGKTEEEIVEALGDPVEIAASFYEDQRLAKALKAEKDIVAVEDIGKVYKIDQKRKRIKKLKKMRVFSGFLLVLFLAILSIYLAAFVAYFAIREHFFAAGPATLLLAFMAGTYILMNLLKQKQTNRTKWVALAGVASFLVSSGLMYTNHWFFQGERYDKTINLSAEVFRNIHFKSNYPVEISVIPIGEKEQPKIEIAGALQKTDQSELIKQTTTRTTITIGKNNFFEPLKKMKKTEIVFFIPAKTKFKTLDFVLNQGTINLSHLQVAELKLAIAKGEVFLSDVYAQNIAINSQKADTTIDTFFADLAIANKAGKSIIKKGQGALELKTKTGLINLNELISKKAILKNQSGKSVISSSQIADLHATNQEGTTILETQTGKTALENGSGKLVLTDIQGELSVTNNSGNVIVYEQYGVDAKLTSESGIVKWIQDNNSPVKFDLSSKSGEIINEFEPHDVVEHSISVTTKTGNIRIIGKNGKQ
ncbi:DUF4097 family beta strand repeat-containing protein [Enterococcus sp. UD-01]|jgi:uncharacterized membrane protein|uniref:DUF4097 family beta strand repeat-containing protein n=1 Tax=Enterococcus sp. UD-01 TaxID=3373911 RepID=UPI00383294DC